MGSKAWWLFVVAFAIGLVATLLVIRERVPGEIARGSVFSTDEGEPVDVVYGPAQQGRDCMTVDAFSYGSTISCFDVETVDESGSYVVVIPESTGKPPLVVGVMPAGTIDATVLVGSASVHADTRGRWFLASLEPGALGPKNDAQVVVKFDTS